LPVPRETIKKSLASGKIDLASMNDKRVGLFMASPSTQFSKLCLSIVL